MKVTARTVLKTGYGLGLLSLAEGRKIASRLKKELELNDEESQKLAKELVATSGAASKEVLKTTSRYFEKALIKSKLAKKSDIARVKKMVKRRVASWRPRKDSLLRRVKRKVTGR